MKRLPQLCALAAFALLLMLAGSAGPSPAHAANNSSDLRAILVLHQQDVAATLSGDPQQLADLFTDDGVLLEPGSAAVVGKPAILAKNRKDKAAHPESRVLSYKPDVRDLRIFHGWAVEWTYFEGSFQESPKTTLQTLHGKALRVMQKLPDGSWRFSRVMWNMAEDSTPSAESPAPQGSSAPN